jgi:16S rRNA (cytosine967-C5)-methyltransferase
MRLYPNLIKAVADGLRQIILENKKADHTVAGLFSSNKSWGARDRNFIADLIYHTIRYKLKWMHVASLDTVETNQDIYGLMAAALSSNGYDIQSIKEFEAVRLNAEPVADLAVLESFSPWIAGIFKAELGPIVADQLMRQLNQPSAMVLRVNTLKTTLEKTKLALDKLAVSYELTNHNALIINQKWALKHSDLYKNGWVEIQDASSQQLAIFADPKPGQYLIDACCGAGGKTLHMAALMQNFGQITAIDVSEFKLNQLKLRAKRAGVKIVRNSFLAENLNLGKLEKSADMVLIDAPCSGLGTLKRDPDIKWKLTEQKLKEIKTLQKDILNYYAPFAKIDGFVVYATCSVLPSENFGQVADFLDKNKNYALVDQVSIWPDQLGFDGFYMAKLKRIA